MKSTFFLVVAIFLVICLASSTSQLLGLNLEKLNAGVNVSVNKGAGAHKVSKHKSHDNKAGVQIPEGAALVCMNIKTGELTYYKQQDVEIQVTPVPDSKSIWEIPQTQAPKKVPHEHGQGKIDIRSGIADK